MENLKIVCPCHFGLESVLSFEMKRLGFENVVSEDGKVSCTGGFNEIAKANIFLRTAERVLISLGEFEATTFEQLFEGTKKLPIEQFVGKQDSFPVTGWSINSQLHSVPDCQSIIKKALVTRLGSIYGISYFEETGPVHQIRFSIHKNKVCIMLDTSGNGLHKRGYRKVSNAAPIKETLAAGILDLARVRNDTVLIDPFCGSGTFLIEGAMRALKIAPGINRGFACEKWTQTPKQAFKNARTQAVDEIDYSCDFHGYGFDIDEGCIEIAKSNAELAKVSRRIAFSKCDISKLKIPEEKATLVTNPPYGERMLDINLCRKLYGVLGKLSNLRPENSCYVISPDEEFESAFGHKADKRRKLYNGMIKCQLYMYFK